jgi:glyoxylase-like metal-dependent hydrolase (beta-lactamase superfamily II)
MSTQHRRSITFIADGEVRAAPTTVFPATTTADWLAHPGLLDEDGRLTFAVGAYLVRGPDLVALVDLGLGPTDVRTATGATYVGGALIANLAVTGITPDDVDLVVYTHLHRDHVGWTTTTTPTGPTITFSNARHVVHTAEWQHWLDHPSPLGPAADTVLEPLADRVHLCTNDEEIAPGLRILATPGHTPGHMSLAVDTDPGRQIVIAGDVLHSPAQIARPDWCFGGDTSPAQGAQSRQRLLDAFGEHSLECGHFPRRSADSSQVQPDPWSRGGRG